ncbi:hypothetical protein [Clostridium butyricum]|uniref:hypothetical protein n=1 Tax=Clostridium butyricum TaxID=1492 RepID=UPI00129BFB78|nr:hypothetical protein [Clostridium butyricum]QGH20658.1 hypothetical protein EBL75_03285 [Clostridium butyricum]QGH24699.1 hypothetical protein EBQ27_03285 [Clostridium butyricum]
MGFKVIDYINRKKVGMGDFLRGQIKPTLVNKAKEKAYWKDRSSHARDGINGGVEGGGDEYSVYLAPGTEYGEWLEKGTGIYGPTGKKIVPVKGNILSWVDGNGKRWFAKSVKGIKPMPILKDTLNNNKEFIIEAVGKYWSD